MAAFKDEVVKERNVTIELTQKEVDTIRAALLCTADDHAHLEHKGNTMDVKVLSKSATFGLQQFFRILSRGETERLQGK